MLAWRQGRSTELQAASTKHQARYCVIEHRTMIPRSTPPGSSFWIACGILLLTTTTVASLAFYMAALSSPKQNAHDEEKKRQRSLSVSFLGNSIQYFNDCPRLVESMLTDSGYTVQQNSCLRGGATLTSLWEKGNGMLNKFSTPPAALPNGGYDIGAPTPAALLEPKKKARNFVLLQDHTQHPTRPSTRQASIDTIQSHLLPLLLRQQSQAPTTVLLLQTFAYRVPELKESGDLGDFHAFTERLAEGYDIYADALRQGGVRHVQIVSMGRAVQWLYAHRRNDLWEALYSWDDFHPSPHGTWLQACLIYLALTGNAPPPYNALWWDNCRYMQPPDQKPLPLPTLQEAEDLRQVAIGISYSERTKTSEGSNCSTSTDEKINSSL